MEYTKWNYELSESKSYTHAILNDNNTGSQENKYEHYASIDTLKYEEGFRRRDRVLESDMLPTKEYKNHVIKGTLD